MLHAFEETWVFTFNFQNMEGRGKKTFISVRLLTIWTWFVSASISNVSLKFRFNELLKVTIPNKKRNLVVWSFLGVCECTTKFLCLFFFRGKKKIGSHDIANVATSQKNAGVGCTVSFVVNNLFTICFVLIFLCFCFVEFPYLMYTTTLLWNQTSDSSKFSN
jgi:hypothetical protein